MDLLITANPTDRTMAVLLLTTDPMDRTMAGLLLMTGLTGLTGHLIAATRADRVRRSLASGPTRTTRSCALSSSLAPKPRSTTDHNRASSGTTPSRLRSRSPVPANPSRRGPPSSRRTSLLKIRPAAKASGSGTALARTARSRDNSSTRVEAPRRTLSTSRAKVRVLFQMSEHAQMLIEH